MRAPESLLAGSGQSLSVRLTKGVLLGIVLTVSPTESAESFGALTLVTPRSNLHEPYRFFGGRTVTVPLLIHASESEGLDVRAQLVQLTSSLSVPITSEHAVLLSTLAADRGGVEIDFSLAVPPVYRETDFELRFRSRLRGDGTWQAAGRIALRVYPSDLLGPVRAWAKSHPLRVEDDRGSLIELLRRQQIAITDQGTGPGITLYAGSRALQKYAGQPLGDGETAVLFTERETDTPYLLVERTGRGTTLRVETRLLDRLDTDPQTHKLLLEIFQHLREQAAPIEGDHR